MATNIKDTKAIILSSYCTSPTLRRSSELFGECTVEVCQSTYKVSGVGGVCNLPGVHGIEGRNLLRWGQINIASLLKIRTIGHVYHGPPKNLDHVPLQTCSLSSATIVLIIPHTPATFQDTPKTFQGSTPLLIILL